MTDYIPVGRENAITVHGLRTVYGLTKGEIRKVLQHGEIRGMCVAKGPDGYEYYYPTEDELEEIAENLLMPLPEILREFSFGRYRKQMVAVIADENVISRNLMRRILRHYGKKV